MGLPFENLAGSIRGGGETQRLGHGRLGVQLLAREGLMVRDGLVEPGGAGEV